MLHAAISAVVPSYSGAARRAMRDAVLMRADIGLWAVVGGRGGDHEASWVAATMAEALLRATAMIDPWPLESAITDGTAEIAAARPHCPAMAAAGVAALHVDGMIVSGATSGNGRIYQLREGRMCLLEAAHGPAAAWPDDVFLLCSDDLCQAVPEGTIRATLRSGIPDLAAKVLVDEARIGGADDTVSLVVVRIADAGTA